MAEILFHNAFRFVTFTLNYLSPSLIADVVLHPFDFATVLLQIGFDPEGLKNEATTLVSALAQYALFTFYIPYLFTSMQGVQFMGLPHPSMFYYVTYIYNKEGILGCYRGIVPKICERIIMMQVSETIKRAISGDPPQRTRADGTNGTRDQEDERFLQSLVNSLCSQFFAVVASHPFHVIMITSFAEFMYEKKSSMYTLAQIIYEDDGFYGFFIGLAPRLVGELFSMTFSLVYTGIVNKQIRPQQENQANQPASSSAAHSVVGYFTDVSRFSAFKPRIKDLGLYCRRTDPDGVAPRHSQYVTFFNSFMGSLTHHHQERENTRSIRHQSTNTQNRGVRSILNVVPLTSKVFYYMMIRDYISKKISYPFFLVCNCMIVLDTGWDKLPLLPYLGPLIAFICILTPKTRCD